MSQFGPAWGAEFTEGTRKQGLGNEKDDASENTVKLFLMFSY